MKSFGSHASSSQDDGDEKEDTQRHLSLFDGWWRSRPVAPWSEPISDHRNRLQAQLRDFSTVEEMLEHDKEKEDNLYGKDDITLEIWNEFKQSLFHLLRYAVYSLTNYEKRPFPQSHIKLVFRCTDELLDVVYKHRKGVIGQNILEILGVTCFFISMKLFYGYDFITEYALMDGIVKIFVLEDRPTPPLPDGSKQAWKDFHKKLYDYNEKLGEKRSQIMGNRKLIEMEFDIMKKTDWKGCKAFSLDRIYDDEDKPSWMFGAVKKSVRKSKTKKSVPKTKTKKSVPKTKTKKSVRKSKKRQ